MNKKKIFSILVIAFAFIFMILLISFSVSLKRECEVVSTSDIRHIKVFYEDSRFGAWPANGGMWSWGEEILVCYSEADHKDLKSGHTYDKSTAQNKFARSLDAGESWTIEDAYQQGITGQAMDHHPGDKAEPTRDLDEPIDFTHPNFALLFQRETNERGPTHFYYTYDRGKNWVGPFNFPNLDSAGITNRTDYIIDGKRELLVFLSIGHGRTGVAQTTDGGLNWKLISYVGPDLTIPEGYSLMPSTLRLSSSEILTTIRHAEGDRVWITSYLSKDNAQTWQKLDDPVKDNVNSPPALIQLPDGRLVLIYIFRRGVWANSTGNEFGSSVCAKISSDAGRSWSEEIILRGKEGANTDVGYPRVKLRPDGKLVLVYYWNNALMEDKPPYRHIAATIWDPE